MTFDEDLQFGDSLEALAQNLADFIADAKTLHTENFPTIKKWEVLINDVWYRIDMNQALIQNPMRKF